MLSNAIVYEGNEPYLYVSCSTEDAAVVSPVLDQLGYDGYRIWYDEECTAKNIVNSALTEKVRHCAVFLVLITNNFASSRTCRSALNTAVESGRTVRVLFLQDVALPQSLAMQIAHAGCTVKFEAITHALLIQKLYADTSVKACHAPGRSFYARKKKNILDLVRAARSESSAEEKSAPEKTRPEPKKEIPPEPEEKPEVKPEPKQDVKPEPKPDPKPEVKPEPDPEPKQEEKPIRVRKVTVKPAPPEEDETVLEAENEEETVLDDTPDGEDADEEKTQLNIAATCRGLLFRLSDESCYIIEESLTRIGRSVKKCDIAFTDNGSISNHHADLVQYRGNYYLRDADSSFGTFLGDEKIEANDRRMLKSGAVFRLSDEYFQFVCGDAAEDLLVRGTIVLLQNTQTQEKYFLTETEQLLDRRHVWPGGTLDDVKISREHARLYEEDGNWFLEDVGSRNGTSVNGRKLGTNEPSAVVDGIRLKIGNTVLQVRLRNLQDLLRSEAE